MRRALVTGIAGFAGSHLTEHLLSNNIEVFGFFHPDHPTENLENSKSRINLIACDILDQKKVQSAIGDLKPELVFHLAAFSSPTQSFKNPRETIENNVFGQINLLESLVAIKSRAKILIIGSADEYGNIPQKFLPATENTPFAPPSPYAVSKVAQDMLGLQFFLHHKLKIVRVRPFNHIGPRQGTNFVVPSFASQIARLEKKGGGVILVGNLENSRDFTDVRDMVRAYLLALTIGEPGQVYNIGSGKPVIISEILRMLLTFAKVPIIVSQDKKRLNPVDIKSIYCDFSKFQKKTAWRPEIPLIQTLSDTIEYERQKLTS